MPANANETNVLALSYRCCLLQKEQQTQAEQLSTAVAEEREQRLRTAAAAFDATTRRLEAVRSPVADAAADVAAYATAPRSSKRPRS